MACGQPLRSVIRLKKPEINTTTDNRTAPPRVSLGISDAARPGLLANASALIGPLGANIIEVAHNRLALALPAKGAEFDIMLETRDARHTEEIMEALRARGYPPRAV